MFDARTLNYDSLNADAVLFTFLRDPVERALSVRAFAAPSINVRDFADLDACLGTGTPRPICTQACNAMTWQFGDALEPRARSVDVDAALARAVRRIAAFDFVGFMGDQLRREVVRFNRFIRRHVHTVQRVGQRRLPTNAVNEAIWLIGAEFKPTGSVYSKFVDAETLRSLRECNAHDQRLYDAAHAIHYDRPGSVMPPT